MANPMDSGTVATALCRRVWWERVTNADTATQRRGYRQGENVFLT